MNVTITRINAAAVALLLALGWTDESAPASQEPDTTIGNNQPFRNPAGHAVTFSTQGLYRELVSREDLRQRLWPDGTFVDFDRSISSTLNRLRSALGDSAARPHYIETVGRRGYRFLYPVSKSPPDRPATPSPGSAPPRTPFRYLRVALPVGLTLVVLIATIGAASPQGCSSRQQRTDSRARRPAIDHLSSDPEQEYLSNGLTDELVTHLASLEGLRVISGASAMQYENSRTFADDRQGTERRCGAGRVRTKGGRSRPHYRAIGRGSIRSPRLGQEL